MESQGRIFIEKELQKVVEATEKLDFPWMSTLKDRQSILWEEKRKIEAQIEKLMTSYGFAAALNRIDFADFWEQADVTARMQFGDLSERQMLNGFYLQEVMHQYAQRIANAIMYPKVD